MALQLSAATMRGIRQENQDHVLVHNILLAGNEALHAEAPPGQTILLGVADGIGGGVCPAQASSAALEALWDVFEEEPNRDVSLFQRLLRAAQAANRSVHALCGGQGGCTLACAAIEPDGTFVTIALGDSPIRLKCASGMRMLFVPQNRAALKQAAGLQPQPGDACQLQAYCGMDGLPPFRITCCGRLQPGDGLLLHTDGLVLPPGKLERLLAKKVPAKDLCVKALVRGSRDNISAVYALMKQDEQNRNDGGTQV